MSPVSPGTRWLAAAAAGATVAAGAVLLTTGTAEAGTISGPLYRDPDTAVARWVAAHPNDSRTAAIRDRIASQPASRWFADFNLGTIGSEVAGYVNAANAAGQIPELTVYGIPDRDCGGASAGGAPDLNQYQNWISAIAAHLGNRTAIVLLEPDSIALQTCLSADQVTARDEALATATRTLKAANPNAKVYLDAGHSAWNSAGEQANRLAAAGVANADGFYSNVSNFNPTSAEVSFGKAVISALNGRGISGKHQIVDTSRNGGASGDWCGDDNTDRRIGLYPTTSTGDGDVDGYLWVKPPGEADGCRYAAGSFQPDLAFSLANGVPNPPSPSSPSPGSPSPSSASPGSSPAPNPGGAACSATYRVTSSWQGGYQAAVTVTAGRAITGWTVGWTLAGGQTISQAWNGTLSVSGSAVTVRNVSWNGSLASGATADFGLIGTGAATTPALTCTAA
ncbi:1, 4-beta cellobiohydrolase [Actinoplanes sp. SE50]|uniref:glycoside hydrolase family 6 protein n=1 Tax=unclassified Actinoplanes TaxID=2626549 RepID=UPI00023EC418|nr:MULTISPECIES: glycoside hydrolase family 6 protein [unclassified Actinoplanes]AEV83042.1 glycoside hydrolase family 6 [Actinoplanes sp. SE50/110]ATO81438.1 1, 4-beta cellobiohydrolase [Actinoplanes sp. SE50]SLL98845.1 1, 4-beta cellobiohydrolase [Actinoplanes sp. SE50/110]